MGKQNKNVTSTGHVFETNNQAAIAVIDSSIPAEFHGIMWFLISSELAYAMTETTSINIEALETCWDNAVVDLDAQTISFDLQQSRFVITPALLETVLRLPANNTNEPPSDVQIREMLVETGYVCSDPNTINLNTIEKKGYRKEWSYFFDTIIKVFSGKVSNFNSITRPMLNIGHSLIYGTYFNMGEVIFYEIASKLETTERKNVYFARFLQLCINNIAQEKGIIFAGETQECHLQHRRIFSDLVRIDLHKERSTVFPSRVSSFLQSNLPVVGTSQVAKKQARKTPGASTTQATKPKPKPQQTQTLDAPVQTTSAVSQQTAVEKSTEPEGSVIGGSKGRGVDENPQDKVGENVEPTNIPTSSSQQDDVSNMETKGVSSQQDAPLSTQSPKGTAHGEDTQLTQSKPKTKAFADVSFQRKKKTLVTTQGAQGTHTESLPEVSKPQEVISSIDVPQIPEEQPTLNTPNTSIPLVQPPSVESEYIQTLLHTPIVPIELFPPQTPNTEALMDMIDTVHEILASEKPLDTSNQVVDTSNKHLDTSNQDVDTQAKQSGPSNQVVDTSNKPLDPSNQVVDTNTTGTSTSTMEQEQPPKDKGKAVLVEDDMLEVNLGHETFIRLE